MVVPTIHSSTTQKDRSKFLPKTGKQKVSDVATHGCAHKHTQTHTHRAIPWDVQLGLVSPLFSSLSQAPTRLCPLIWACSAGLSLLPGTSLAHPSALSLPSHPPHSSPRPEALLRLWRVSHLCPQEGSRGFGQQLRSGAKQRSRVPSQSDRTGVLGGDTAMG